MNGLRLMLYTSLFIRVTAAQANSKQILHLKVIPARLLFLLLSTQTHTHTHTYKCRCHLH